MKCRSALQFVYVAVLLFCSIITTFIYFKIRGSPIPAFIKEYESEMKYILTRSILKEMAEINHVFRFGFNPRKQEEIMRKRMHRLKGVCESDQWKTYSQSVFPSASSLRMIFNQDLKLAACKVEKAGSTELGRVLLILQNRIDTHRILSYSGNKIHSLTGNFSAVFSIKDINPTWNRFLILRDPYSRLLSGYVDKIFLMKFPSVAKEIALIVRNKPVHTKCVTDITFQEFLDFLVIKADRDKQLDNHFTPIFATCNPCNIEYEYLIKLESLFTDMKYVLTRMNVSSPIMQNVERLHSSFVKTSVQSLVMTAYGFSYHKHQCLTKKELERRLWTALQIQGYLKSDVSFKKDLFNNAMDRESMVDIFWQEVKRQNVSKVERGQQRNQILSDFYKDVPIQTIRMLQRLYKMDFLAFGYNVTPPSYR